MVSGDIYCGFCKKCGKYGALHENYCASCRSFYLKQVVAKREKKNNRNLDISLSKNTSKDVQKYSCNEFLSVRQKNEFNKTAMTRELWEKHYQNDFPHFKRYLNVMRAWGADVNDKVSVDSVIRELDCVLVFERGKSIQQVLKEWECEKR
jgi:hypothetical protein